MEIAFCLKGIAVGFVLCAPLGPVGVLCLQRTLAAGRLAGFCAILGAAVVDGFYGMAAGLGMTLRPSSPEQAAAFVRADVTDPVAFERFLQKAFARRRRTLENNLEDSYPNLKEYFRFLDIQGSRRPETLSVVEFAGIWRAVRSDPAGARG